MRAGKDIHKRGHLLVLSQGKGAVHAHGRFHQGEGPADRQQGQKDRLQIDKHGDQSSVRGVCGKPIPGRQKSIESQGLIFCRNGICFVREYGLVWNCKVG